jgi:hypothetical protein
MPNFRAASVGLFAHYGAGQRHELADLDAVKKTTAESLHSHRVGPARHISSDAALALRRPVTRSCSGLRPLAKCYGLWAYAIKAKRQGAT